MAEGDERMRTVKGQSLARAWYWRREDGITGRIGQMPPPVATAAAPGEERKAYRIVETHGEAPARHPTCDEGRLIAAGSAP